MTKTKKTVHSKYSVYIYITLVACMASIFGFNLGSILSSKVRLINIFMLEIYDIDSMVNTFLLGTFVGTFLGGRLVAETGRVQSILGAFCLGVIGQSTAILSPTFSKLFISEFAVGAAFGVYLISSVCYVTELAPMERRGTCCSLVAVFLTFGLLLATLLHSVLPNNGILIVVIILFLSVPILITSYVKLPESPRWLALTDSSDRALTELIRLRQSTSEAARELAAINECVLGEERGVGLFFRSSIFRAVLWYFVLVSVACHISGIAIVPYMSMQLIQTYQAALGIIIPLAHSEINFTLLTFILLAVFFGALFTFFTVDKIGRRNLLLCAILTNEIIIACLYVLIYGNFRSFGEYAIVGFIWFFVFSSAVAMVIIINIVSSELLAAKGREFGLTVIYLTNLAAIMLGMYFFHKIMQSYGILLMLCFFLLSGAFLFTRVYSGLPETRKKMLENMENTIFNEKSLLALKTHKD